MINTTRRLALKLLSTTAVITGSAGLLSAKALAGFAPQPASAGSPHQPDSLDQEITDISLSVERSRVGRHAIVTFTNRSATARTIRYISPGIVRAEGEVYDLNTLVMDFPLTMGANDVVRLPVAPAGEHAEEAVVPSGLVMSKPVVLKTRLAGAPEPGHVRTIRSVFA